MQGYGMEPLPFDPECCLNESEVESKFVVQWLLPVLGYQPSNWNQEVVWGNVRLDFMIYSYTRRSLPIPASLLPSIVLEAKAPRRNLDQHVAQLKLYMRRLRARYGILTNGRQFRIYELAGDNHECSLIYQCRGRQVVDNIREISAIVGKDSIKSKSSLNVEVEVSPLGQNQQVESVMKTIAVFHNKGGVGKTTTVVNLAAALTRKSKKVLVVDLDSQANTTYATGLIKFQDKLNDDILPSYIYHILMVSGTKIKDVARQCVGFSAEPFDVIPCHIDFMKWEQDVKERAGVINRLRNKLKLVKQDYDFVLIDTPPSLNVYTRVALVAADYLIIPSDLKPFANQGLDNVKSLLSEVNEYRVTDLDSPPVEILGVLPSKVMTNPRFIQSTLPKMEATIKDSYGVPILDTRIFERRAISACLEKILEVGDLIIPDPKSIFDFDPKSPSAEEFEQLSKEVIEKVGG